MLTSTAPLEKLRLGVVPEHFSTPLYLSSQPKGPFHQNGIDLDVIDCPCGTGEMMRKLEAGELDMAIVVTEGFVAAKLKGDTNLLALGTYVTSPLCWAASTGAERPINSLKELEQPVNFGISRLGSGSQVMANYLYHQSNAAGSEWLPPKFTVLGDVYSLRQGVIDGTADVFLWEKFTTKPHYDSGHLKYIGEVVAPWSSFTIITHRDRQPAVNYDVLSGFVSVLTQQLNAFAKNEALAHQSVMAKFPYSLIDVQNWWKTVRYAKQVSHLNLKEILHCATVLSSSTGGDPSSIDEETVKSWSWEGVAKWV